MRVHVDLLVIGIAYFGICSASNEPQDLYGVCVPLMTHHLSSGDKIESCGYAALTASFRLSGAPLTAADLAELCTQVGEIGGGNDSYGFISQGAPSDMVLCHIKTLPHVQL